MTRNRLAMASLALVISMLALAAMVASRLPADMQLPTHWNLEGEADGFSGKWPALLMPAAITAAMSLLMYFLPSLEPRGQGLKRSQGLYLSAWAGLLLMGVAIELVTIAAALGWSVPADRVIMGTVGVILVLIGNQLGKSRSMYLVGIRTPWTLASEEVWIKTHRLGGKLMVGAGALMIIASILPVPPELRGIVIGASIAIAVLVPVVYSYVLWRRETKGQASE
jgi:uncharacterized membrane protein